MINLTALTPKQKKVLMLRSKGKEFTKIAREEGEKYNSVREAFERGRKNLDDAINIVEWAIKEQILLPAQVQHLKKSLRKG